jgi:hypothetical protein
MVYAFAREYGVKPTLSPIIKSAVFSCIMFFVMHWLSGVITSAHDGKLMLVVKCAAAGVAALAVYALIMKKNITKIMKEGGK